MGAGAAVKPEALPSTDRRNRFERVHLRDPGVRSQGMTDAGQGSSWTYPCLKYRCVVRPTGVVQEVCAVIRQTRRISSIVTPTAHAATATPMGAAATAAESSTLWPSFIHRKRAAFQGLSI